MPFQPGKSTYIPAFGESTHSCSLARIVCAGLNVPLRRLFILFHCFLMFARGTCLCVSPLLKYASNNANFWGPPIGRACVFTKARIGDEKFTAALGLPFSPRLRLTCFWGGFADAVAVSSASP